MDSSDVDVPDVDVPDVEASDVEMPDVEVTSFYSQCPGYHMTQGISMLQMAASSGFKQQRERFL